MKISLKDRRALVTGAGQGIGRGICEAIADSGGLVTAVDIDETALSVLVRDGIECAALDVTDAAAVLFFVAESGPFDVVVHVAGGVRGQVGRPVESVSPEDWDAIASVNQTAVFLSSALLRRR